MGYARALFLKPAEIRKQFICGVCNDVIKEPMVLYPCEHAVCTACTGRRKTCPSDRRLVKEVKQAQRPFKELLNELQLWCPYNASGCTTVVLLGDLPAHELECDSNPGNYAECGGGCGAIMKVNRGRMPGQEVHNCVQFMNGKLVATEEELELTKAQLVDKEKELKEFRVMKMAFKEKEKELKATKKELAGFRRESELKNNSVVGPSQAKKQRRNSKNSDPPVTVICTKRWGLDLSSRDHQDNIIYEGVENVIKIYSIVLGNNLSTKPPHHKTELFIERTKNQLSKRLERVKAKAHLTAFKWENKSVDQPQPSSSGQLGAPNQEQDQDPKPGEDIGLEFEVNIGDGYWVQVLLPRIAD